MVKFYKTYSSSEFVAALPQQIKITDLQLDTIAAALPPQLRDERQIVSFIIDKLSRIRLTPFLTNTKQSIK